MLKYYDKDHVDRIALPLGGIGTGTVSLGGRGNLQDGEILNRPAKGYNPRPKFEIAPFFVLFTDYGNHKNTHLLEGPVPLYEYEGSRGVYTVVNHGMPRFERTTFDTAYPFGQVNLFHVGLTVKVRIKGFNPLVPPDAQKSGIPVASLKFEIMNTSDNELNAAQKAKEPNAVDKSMSFKAREGKYFWSNGYQYGTIEIKKNRKNKLISLTECDKR